MATPTAYSPPKMETIILYKNDESKTAYISDIYDSLCINMGIFDQMSLDETGSDLRILETNNKFIDLFTEFNNQYKILTDLYSGFSYLEIERIFSKTCSKLLELNPDKISVELTYNQSIVFTFKKDSYTFFFERFIDDSNQEKDEVIFSFYKDAKKLPSFAGSFELAISSIEKELNPNHKYYCLELSSINELSF